MTSSSNNSPPRLSDELLQSLAKIIAPGSTVASVSPVGQTSWNVSHMVGLRLASGTGQNIFVRRYGGPRELGKAKALLEFKTLKLLQQRGIPAPAPLYADADGAVTGWPGIVTAKMPGRQVVAPPDFSAWARTMARMLARVHSVAYDPAAMSFLLDANREAAWFLRNEKEAAARSAYPEGRAVIEQVRRLHATARPAPPVLVHSDYWAGNILWEDGLITCVLDWEEAARGDPGIDVAYCRMDISMRGLHDTADEFMAEYESETGRRVGNLGLWELAAAARAMPDPERWVSQWRSFGDTTTTDESARMDLDIFIARARQRSGV